MFRFTIRDVLWLTVVVALAVGWYFHSTTLWMGKMFAEQEMRLQSEELQRLRSQIAERP